MGWIDGLGTTDTRFYELPTTVKYHQPLRQQKDQIEDRDVSAEPTYTS